MSHSFSVAASLSPDIRQGIGIQVLASTEPISHIAATHQVSRKFVYQQGDKAQQALDESFAPSQGDDDVLLGPSLMYCSRVCAGRVRKIVQRLGGCLID